MRFESGFDTKASPEQVLAALTDFSDKRLETWQGTLDPDKFEVYEVGETSARVREGSKRPDVWAVEQYDWSEPGHIARHSSCFDCPHFHRLGRIHYLAWG